MAKAFQAYIASFRFLKQNGLLWLLWFPLIVTALVIYCGLSLTSWATDFLSMGLTNWMESIDWLNDLSGIIGKILYALLWIILRIMLYFIMTFVGGSIILLIMSPLLTIVSENVATAVGANVPDFKISVFFRDLWRAIKLALKNGLIQLILTIGCFALGFVPIAGFAAPFLMFFINAYFYGFSFMDYSLERMHISASESGKFVWSKKWKTIGIGMPFTAWMLIPFFGPMTSGFMALFATVSATLALEKPVTEAVKTAP
jgi:CysZ protein